jgi:hypothetical protein
MLARLETRRELFVQRAKSSPAYTQSIGETLRIIPPSTPFDPVSYQPTLKSMMCTNPKSVTGRFRKEGGNVDGILLQGRRDGASGWDELGKFTAVPFTAEVPTAGTAPEIWEFQARL